MEKSASPLSGEPAPTPLSELRSLCRIALFAALVGVGAFIHIPFGPLHLSFQTMAIMLAGFVLGPRKAVLALLAYLACGFIGMPMFGRGKAGPASFLGPSAGYLVGFVVGAAVAGMSTLFVGGRRRRVAAMLLFGALGTATILALGAVGLRVTLVDSWSRAFAVGMLPFLPGDLVKMLVAVAIREAFFPETES